MLDLLGPLLGILLCILLAALFSGSETAFYGFSRLGLRLRRDREEPGARMLAAFAAHSRPAISTMLVGTNLGVYLATALCTQMLYESYAGRAQFYAGLLLPPILFVLADMLPKTVAHGHPDAVMYRTVWLLWPARIIFYPVTLLLRGVSALPHLVFGHDGSSRPAALTRESLQRCLRKGSDEGVLSHFQRNVAMNILHLRTVRVQDVMTPLADVAGLARDASGQAVRDTLRRHAHSRLLVFGDAPEEIVGIVHVIDVATAEDAPSSAAEMLRPVEFVAPDLSVPDALRSLRHARQSLCVVAGEDGRARGIVTIKDLVEEIVGELDVW
jgi:magnesium and cobalt exporter, CNNM family